MKKIFSLLWLCTTIVFSSCQKENDTTPVPVSVSGVTLNKEVLPLVKGEKTTLIATVSPDCVAGRTVIWSCNNETIATVSATGEVTALALGTAVITASAVSDGTKKATCTVTVTAAGVAVGDFYYYDRTYSTTFDKTKECVGLVFVVNADGKTGKVVSLDEGVDKDWKAAQVWKSRISSPGMQWYTPSMKILQQLYCAYIGVPTGTWGVINLCPFPVVAGAKDVFNSKLITAGGMGFSDRAYWSYIEDQPDHGMEITFNRGYSEGFPEYNKFRVRVVFDFH